MLHLFSSFAFMKLDRNITAANLCGCLLRLLFFDRRGGLLFLEVFIDEIEVRVFVKQILFHIVIEEVSHKAKEKISAGEKADDNGCGKKIIWFFSW